MAMFAPIPLPGIDNPQFKDVMDYFAQMKEMNQKKPLQEAQAQEAQANALKAKMFANLINQAFGGAGTDAGMGKEYQLSPEERMQKAAMQPGDSMVVGQGGQRLPSGGGSNAEKAKQMLYAMGFLKETPQEETARQEQMKIAAEQRGLVNKMAEEKGTQGIKSGFDLKKSARSLADTNALVDQLDSILAKNPNLTGIGAGAANKFNLSNNPELGKFITTAGRLQAELGKYASSRGGIQAVKWAQSVKPSEWKGGKFNKGMISAIRENLQNDFERIKDEYKDATGEELPIDLHSGKGEIVKWKMVNGQPRRA